ncbi:hypothetical protein FA09DRAFT_220409 [Tilletiopsis washingtonensis]|uniref:Uncharacterized protein n=1 Tax=Tilletiopsis washingtonensis TaxID=58919 RepID=A0A316ZDN0_9BASI|nr:hypothetical protein FA09DRAFT_220409 [Tilletiopsis washingtonensis]PWN99820.1 hypothetical protein FA09DRAFT_220409 [Tilletiopsis washingtonensis]
MSTLTLASLHPRRWSGHLRFYEAWRTASRLLPPRPMPHAIPICRACSYTSKHLAKVTRTFAGCASARASRAAPSPGGSALHRCGRMRRFGAPALQVPASVLGPRRFGALDEPRSARGAPEASSVSASARPCRLRLTWPLAFNHARAQLGRAG